MTSANVQGVWAIHHALLREQTEALDLFHLTGSTSSILGTSHAADAASDAFLDAFVSFRHSLGLPASCLSVDITEDSFVANESAILDCLELVLRPGAQRTQVVRGLARGLPPASPEAGSVQRTDPRLLIWHIPADGNANDSSSSSSSLTPHAELHQFLDSIRSNPAVLKSAYASELLAREIGAALLGLMMRPREDLDVEAPLSTFGIDSLVGLEVRNWMRRTLLVELTAQDIVQAKNVRELGVLAQKMIADRAKENI